MWPRIKVGKRQALQMLKNIITHIFQYILPNAGNMIDPIAHAGTNDDQGHQKGQADQ